MPEPSKPDAETRDELLATLSDLIAHGGARPFLLDPIAPGVEAFPDPWQPSRAGTKLLLRRLLWHAGIEREIELDDRRFAGALPTERKPATRVELVEVDATKAVFALGFIGDDDIVGTLAHEVGTIHALLNRPDADDPYRTAEPPVLVVEPDHDPERGSIATVYLGLGVLAANAAYQQYSRGGKFNGGYVPLEYDVLNAGAVPMSDLAFLLAVQAVVRGEDAPPAGLGGPQRDEVSGWMKALAASGGQAALCERLGIALADADAAVTRPEVVPFADVELEDDEPIQKTAFRWQTNRGGVGLVAGTLLGVGLAFGVPRGLVPLVALGGAATGHVIGRRVRRPRCSACATIVLPDASKCWRCGASLRGDIHSLNERLVAEERLEQQHDEQA